MKSLYSMFLSQAYQDCWDDYNRSVKLKNFPRWDYVILTASNDQQVEGFRRQIEERKEYLPAGTRFAAIPDRDGERVGSGGATLEVLKISMSRRETSGSCAFWSSIPVATASVCRSIPHWGNCSRRCPISCQMDAALRFLMNS